MTQLYTFTLLDLQVRLGLAFGARFTTKYAMSTGNPKPIPYNVAALLSLTSMNIVPPDFGQSPVTTMLQNQNHLSLFPGFHVSPQIPIYPWCLSHSVDSWQDFSSQYWL